jgi:hypothetical protein
MKTSKCNSDRDAGINAFCQENDGGGWMLPETLRLKLATDEFTVFPKQSNGMIFECYPAEAIWAGFVQSARENCDAYAKKGVSLPDARDVKAYKSSKANRVTFNQFSRYVTGALTIISRSKRLPAGRWNRLVAELICQLGQDDTSLDPRSA